MDTYLQKLQKNEGFLQKMRHRFNDKIIEDMIIFDNVTNGLTKFHEKILLITRDTLDKTKNGLISFSRIEDRVLNECKQDITLFNINIGQIKKTIKQIALQNKIMFMNFLSGSMFFSLEHFFIKPLEKEYLKPYLSKCGIDCTINLNKAPLNEFNISNIPQDYDKFEHNLDDQIDINKIVVVDNIESLKVARQDLCNASEVGVDIEGHLEKEGWVELIQVATNDKIFIFDIYMYVLIIS